jgi:hypothetical protein
MVSRARSLRDAAVVDEEVSWRVERAEGVVWRR